MVASAISFSWCVVGGNFQARRLALCVGVWHLAPEATVEQGLVVASLVWVTSQLFDEESNVCFSTLLTEIAQPVQLAGTSSRPALAAGDRSEEHTSELQ